MRESTLLAEAPARPALKPYAFELDLKELAVIFALSLGIYLTNFGAYSFRPFNIYLSIAWSLPFPITLIALSGARRSRALTTSTYEGVLTNKLIFVIPSVARLDTMVALERVIDSVLAFAGANFPFYRIDVVVEENSEGLPRLRQRYRDAEVVNLIPVPAAYQTPLGAFAKARAMHYALALRNAGGEGDADTWVYHLDDDTAVSAETIASLAEFIATRGDAHFLAQGVLTFPHELSPSFVCRLADSIRPLDDLGRLSYLTGVRGTPLLGLHGEHLLVRADIESEIGWDFGPVKVEDSYFGLRFAELYPGRSGFLNSRVFGASPASIGDLLKQRRRWASGLLALTTDGKFSVKRRVLLGYATVIWTTSMAANGVILTVVSLGANIPLVPALPGIGLLWMATYSFWLWAYFEGLRLNLQASAEGMKTRRLVYLATIIFLFFSVLTTIEAIGAGLGLWDFIRGKRNFEVIRKGR